MPQPKYSRRLGRKIGATAFTLFAIICTIYALTFPQEIRCYLIEVSSMERIAPNVYAEPAMPSARRQDLLVKVRTARERIRFFWGEQLSDPILIITSNLQVYELYGSDFKSPGMNHATPFGAYVVLSPEGMDEDVIAHELCHAELLTRIGWQNRLFDVPVWFDEGLALTFDYRYTHSEAMWNVLTENGVKAPTLNQLDTRAEFNSISLQSPYLSYVTAKREVFRWMNTVGIDGLFALIERVREGESFDKVYAELEREAAPLKKATPAVPAPRTEAAADSSRTPH